MTSVLLLGYTIIIIAYVVTTSTYNNIRITLEVDNYFRNKANYMAMYGTVADWNEVMDARSYFWNARTQ